TTGCSTSRNPSGCPRATSPRGRSTTTNATPSKPHLTIVFAALAVSLWIEDTTGWSIKKFVRTARRRPTTRRPPRDPANDPRPRRCALTWHKSGHSLYPQEIRASLHRSCRRADCRRLPGCCVPDYPAVGLQLPCAGGWLPAAGLG